jgi:coproporphyrinogen III oxidase
MSYNLTDRQKHLLRWVVGQVREGNLTEEFSVSWFTGGFNLHPFSGDKGDLPKFSKGSLDALEAAGVLLVDRRILV